MLLKLITTMNRAEECKVHSALTTACRVKKVLYHAKFYNCRHKMVSQWYAVEHTWNYMHINKRMQPLWGELA
jgi:hypothetical protein